MTPPLLSVIIVSWNTRELLRACLDSLLPAPEGLALQILVVDNGSQDGTPAMVRESFPAVELLESGRNLGFSAGNNLALARARGRYLMLLNPDTIVHEGALTTLVAFLADHPNAGLVGPQIRYADGSLQPSRHRFPTLLTLFVASTPLHAPLRALLGSYYLSGTPETAQLVGWLSGAALLLRREVYEQVGGLDERFFMYFEETDWQRRIRAAGWSIWYVPAARITHYEDGSSGQVRALRLLRFNRSRLLYVAKWHGAIWGRWLRGWLALLYGVEWLKEAVKWLLGHRRPLRRARMGAYAALVGRGMRLHE